MDKQTEKAPGKTGCLVRALLAIILTPIVLIAVLWLDVLIPRHLATVEIGKLDLVRGDAIERLNDQEPGLENPARWLRIELLADRDLVERELEIGATDDLYVENDCCSKSEPLQVNGMVRGPFPDDMPQSPLHDNLGAPSEKTRPAMRGGKYHYTVYISADRLRDFHRDLQMRITAAYMFAPHGESAVLTIPDAQIRQALSQANVAQQTTGIKGQ